MGGPIISEPRFKVSINGVRRCVAGFSGYAVLSAGIDHVRGQPGCRSRESVVIDGVARVRVGGLQNRNHLDWLREDLIVGDEVSIQVADGGPIDATIPRDDPPGSTHERLDRRRDRLATINNERPHRMSVLVNGEQRCIIGVASGVMSVMMTWVRRDPTHRAPHSTEPPEDHEGGMVDLHVGGLENDVHLDWMNCYLEAGDEVTIRVLGPGSFDPPEGQHPRDSIPHENKAFMYGPRVTFRGLVGEDLDFFLSLLSNPDVMRHHSQPLDRDEIQEWLSKQMRRFRKDRGGYWMIVDNQSHERIGVAGLISTEVEGERLLAVDCLIHPKFQRKRYGIDAVWTCIQQVDRLTPRIAYALIRPDNAPAREMAGKLGLHSVRTVQHLGAEHHLMMIELPE